MDNYIPMHIKYIDNKILKALNLQEAVEDLIDANFRFKSRIITDISKLNSSELSNNERCKDIVKHSQLRIDQLNKVRIKKMNLTTNSFLYLTYLSKKLNDREF